MRRRGSLSTMLYGPPPPAGAPQSQMLRWIRQASWRLSPWFVLVVVIGVLFGFARWLWIVIGVCVAMMLANQLVLTARIRRLQRSEQSQ